MVSGPETLGKAMARSTTSNPAAVARRALTGLLLAVLVCLASGVARAASQPLSKDDITLLLIGGASSQKVVGLIEQRGIDFQMGPDLAKKFHDQGASDEVIEALTRASQKRAQAAARAPRAAAAPAAAKAPPAAAPNPNSESVREAPPAPSSQPAAAGSQAPQPAKPAASVEQRIQQTLAEKVTPIDEDAAPTAAPARTRAAKTAPPPPKDVKLKDPSPAEIQHIIQEFAAKETLFKQARDNYTYHQINKVEELGPNDVVEGTFRQDWDILFDDNGKRIEQVTYAPVPTLKRLMVTQQDLDQMRSINPFVLTTSELPEYDIEYMGHVPVDYITTYVFSVRPREIKKGHQYFKGIIWVDDHDLQIVKAEGRTVPELKTKHGENLFPRFTTYRQQIDGKYWFPTFTSANDVLYFATGPVHIKEIIRYTDYKQYKSTTTIKMVNEVSPSQTPPKKPPKPKN